MRKYPLGKLRLCWCEPSVWLMPAPANPSQGQYGGPYGAGPATNNNNNAWGIANTPSGSNAAGPLSTIYAPNTIAVPRPAPSSSA